MTQNDKAGTAYWNENWAKANIPIPYDHTDRSLNNYVDTELHKYFQKAIGNRRGFSILEIGCANSVWPIYFHRYFDAEVFGLDYSEIGCEKSRTILKHYGVPGTIYYADLFSPPTELFQKFDFVISFGVIEHFENTSECLKSCAAFVKPGGIMLTLIPNMTGVIGRIQKYVDRSVYDVHVPLDKKMLINAHQAAKLDIQDCDYFMSINLNVVNSGAFSSHPFNKYFRKALSVFTKIFWVLEKNIFRMPRNKLTSPYIMAVAVTTQKP